MIRKLFVFLFLSFCFLSHPIRTHYWSSIAEDLKCQQKHNSSYGLESNEDEDGEEGEEQDEDIQEDEGQAQAGAQLVIGTEEWY